MASQAIPDLQQQIASLLLYQSVLDNKIGQTFLALLRSLRQFSDLKNDPEDDSKHHSENDLKITSSTNLWNLVSGFSG